MESSAVSGRGLLRKSKVSPAPRAVAPVASRFYSLLTRHPWRWITPLILALGIGSFLVWKSNRQAPAAKPGSHYAYADQLWNTPDSGIDVGIVALTLEKDFAPGLDVAAYSSKIDDLVAKVRMKTDGALDPGTRIRAINTVIYQDEGYSYDMGRLGKEDIENVTLHGLLDTKKGNCLTLTTLYMAVAKRLGYPVYAVAMPKHAFLRYVGADFQLYNIEPTSEGGYSKDESYIQHCNPTQQSINSGAYLRTLYDTEFIGFLFAKNADAYGVANQYGKALDCLEAAYHISPQYTPVLANLGAFYEVYSKQLKGKEAAYYRETGEKLFRRVVDLGDGDIIGPIRKGFEAP